ncbi:MAG: hypothetical protein AB8I08_20390 [Sandaracinaceae bacterium]
MGRTARWRGLCVALLVAASPAVAHADDSLRVLFIGNSYTRFNDLPAMVEAAADSVPEGPRLQAERETHGGYNLRRHWRVERVRDLVANGGFQRVVLQPHSLSPLNETDELSEYAARFQAHASAAGADVVLFQTWARHPESPAYRRLDVDDATAMNARIETVYSRLGEALDAPVAPVGDAWRRALTEDPELELHRDDGTHPAVTGTYLSALVLYGTLTGVDPRRVEWRHWQIPRRRAARIRQIAAETLGYGDEVALPDEAAASRVQPADPLPNELSVELEASEDAPDDEVENEAARDGVDPAAVDAEEDIAVRRDEPATEDASPPALVSDE